MKHLLIDTDVLIWFAKGNANAVEVIQQLDNFSMSTVTYMELMQGMRNKKEVAAFHKMLKQYKVTVIHIDIAISTKAMQLIDNYVLSHTLYMADALIAATSLVTGLPLLSGNVKDYRFIEKIQLIPFSPIK